MKQKYLFSKQDTETYIQNKTLPGDNIVVFYFILFVLTYEKGRSLK